jgi:hypothetical protein
MAEYRVRYGQTIFDVAVQNYGHIEGIAFLIQDNVGVTLNTTLVSGEILSINTSKVIDSGKVNYLKDNKVVIANYDEEVRISDQEGYWVDANGDFVIDEQGNKILA